jgi:hypothetical protein
VYQTPRAPALTEQVVVESAYTPRVSPPVKENERLSTGLAVSQLSLMGRSISYQKKQSCCMHDSVRLIRFFSASNSNHSIQEGDTLTFNSRLNGPTSRNPAPFPVTKTVYSSPATPRQRSCREKELATVLSKQPCRAHAPRNKTILPLKRSLASI